MPDGAPAMFSQKSGFTEISKQEPGVSLTASFHRMRHTENICAHFQKPTLWKVSWIRPLKLLSLSKSGESPVYGKKQRGWSVFLSTFSGWVTGQLSKIYSPLSSDARFPPNKRNSYQRFNNPRYNMAAWVLCSHWYHSAYEWDLTEAWRKESTGPLAGRIQEWAEKQKGFKI